MYCNVHVLYKMIFSNKFGFILETVFPYNINVILLAGGDLAKRNILKRPLHF